MFVKEQSVGNGVACPVPSVVGETVNPYSASAGSIKTVQAIEETTVNERRLSEQLQKSVGFGHFVAVAIHRKIAVVVVVLPAEPALANFGIQRGEEQVLQHGPVVGIASATIIVFQQLTHPVLYEQFLCYQPLLLDEPYEHQASNETDNMLIRSDRLCCRIRELGGCYRLLKPPEKVLVEAAVQFLSIKGSQPRRQQAVEIVGLAVVVHPAQSSVQRQFG